MGDAKINTMVALIIYQLVILLSLLFITSAIANGDISSATFDDFLIESELNFLDYGDVSANMTYTNLTGVSLDFEFSTWDLFTNALYFTIDGLGIWFYVFVVIPMIACIGLIALVIRGV